MRLSKALWLLLLPSLSAAADRPAAAVELARITLPRATWDEVVAATSGQMSAMSEQMLQQADLPAAERGEALAAVQAEMKDFTAALMPSYEEMLDFQASMLAKHWTAAELRELGAFYRSPVGRKTVQVMPEIMKDSMGWMQARMQQRLPEVMERIKARAQEAAAKRGKGEAR